MNNDNSEDRVARYSKLAGDTRSQAERIKSPKTRVMMLQIADTLDGLARFEGSGREQKTRRSWAGLTNKD
jgi:hypothetical protein